MVTSDQDLDISADLYLGLIRRCLTRELFLDQEVRNVDLREWPLDNGDIRSVLKEHDWRLVTRSGDPGQRAVGHDWPPTAETMAGSARLENTLTCCRGVLENDVAGDFIETGVWRGGNTILMRAVLAAYGVTDRTVWVADSFEGLPVPDGQRYPADEGVDFSIFPQLAVSAAQVRANFDRYELLDDQVRFLEGWFADTLPTAPITDLAVLRLDGDLYQSTMDALTALYPKLSVGGYVIVDDYGAFPSCAAAIDDYRLEHDITDSIVSVDWTGAYWQRTS